MLMWYRNHSRRHVHIHIHQLLDAVFSAQVTQHSPTVSAIYRTIYEHRLGRSLLSDGINEARD
ncbi:hypothetical protein CBR67_06935 [Bordetella hinzii]|uniref:Uncharacterized protein n=1 Tax=Bordetella hinzii TaxID=103855 RepID=A0AAN1VF91_9BORD|nr:hypothetical protein CS347_05970 [Bordetella hinzii]KXA72399.1 hypothetical protein AXA74_13165 [Bordetella hinzii LMG 13501]QDJ36403.1 hypothetical protein CBR67_06935 [Bordetella hinzii]